GTAANDWTDSARIDTTWLLREQGFGSWKSKRGTGYRLSAIGRLRNDLQNLRAVRVSNQTPSLGALSVPLNAQTAHDLQQARVIRQAQFLRRLGHVPLIALQRLNHDLSLGLLLLFFERASSVVRRA